MSLVKCKECHNKISSEAKSCPKCGVKVKSGLSLLSISYIVVISAIIIMVFIGSQQQKARSHGTGISGEWDELTTCQTARLLIKNGGLLNQSEMDSLYKLPCTLTKVYQPLLGKYSAHEPYAVSWPNGIAARVFVTERGLRMMGLSKEGISTSW
ncbi:MAG: hypothetical protein ACI9U0_002157 [Flavobacteriales bacterium]